MIRGRKREGLSVHTGKYAGTICESPLFIQGNRFKKIALLLKIFVKNIFAV